MENSHLDNRPTHPTPLDPHARPARSSDAGAIARIQANAFAEAGARAEDSAAALDHLREQWQAAIENPPSREHHIFVAVAGPEVCGFATLVPTDDPTQGELSVLEVAPQQRRRGHASRLLAALVDVARDGGWTSMRTWAFSDDDARTRFLDSAGFGPQGSTAGYEIGGRTLTAHCWWANITPETP